MVFCRLHPLPWAKKEKREAGAKKQPEVGGVFVGSDIFLGNATQTFFTIFTPTYGNDPI